MSAYTLAKDEFAHHYWGTFDWALLERDALNYMIMGDYFDYFDGPLAPNIIECTDYRELEPEPLLLPTGEAKDV